LDTAADRARARRLQEQASLAEADIMTGGVSIAFSIEAQRTHIWELGGRPKILAEPDVRISRRAQTAAAAFGRGCSDPSF
jgi:hypothetical protein